MIFLTEKKLEEKLPYDLLQAYRNTLKKYMVKGDSANNPATIHGELINPDAIRRGAVYDYGKASYEEISKEDALRLIKQNKHNVESLRIIYHGDLVELEVRPNGSIYPIYSDRKHEFIASDGTRYKNIAFAPYQKIIKTADKIYKTDEYEHQIEISDPDTIERRKANSTLSRIGSIGKTKEGDNRLNPARTFFQNPRIQIKQRDTGSHRKDGYTDSETFYGVTTSNISSTDEKDYNQFRYSRYDPPVEQYRKLMTKEQEKKDAKKRLSIAVNALNKLETEKEQYSQAEYDELKSMLSDKVKEAEKAYKNSIAMISLTQKEAIDHFNENTTRLNIKLGRYMTFVENSLKKAYDLKSKIEADISTKGRYSELDLREIINRLETALENAQKFVNNTSEIDQNDSNVEDKLKAQINALTTFRKEVLKQNLDTLHQDEAELKALQDKFDEIQMEFKPKTQAKKARQAVQDRKELDPALIDIVDFE